MLTFNILHGDFKARIMKLNLTEFFSFSSEIVFRSQPWEHGRWKNNYNIRRMC